jgi:hypothetical protein
MTQQYIAGQFSVLLAEMEPVPGEWRAAVRDLRRKVEISPLSMLPRLAGEAMVLIDRVCWVALEEGDAAGFRRAAETGAALRAFTANAGLIP